MNHIMKGARFGLVLPLVLWLAGCTQTYPADRIKESIQEICRKEYGVEGIDVKVNGSTIGVYLPIKKLFVTDFKEAVLKGGLKVSDVENLFRPSPEALEQVEDVLFSISRVLLSTNMKIDFYTLQATDVEQTGLQLILTGYVDDIKRVRLWDISREEYRKRVLHEIRMNRAAVWHHPVRLFFKTLEENPSLASLQPYFEHPISPEFFESLFYLKARPRTKSPLRWKLGELRGTTMEGSRVIVHVPVTVEYQADSVSRKVFPVPSGATLEYFFILSFASESPKIARIVPLFFLDEDGKVQKMDIPEELTIEKDIASWETEFSFIPIRLGDFLAEQLTRRTQALLFSDERVQNTFQKLQMMFRYHQEARKNYFSFEMDAKLKTPTPWASAPMTALHEDMLHVLNLASREFVEVLRSYQFSDYDFLQLNLASDPTPHTLGRDELELFRRNKTDLQGLLGGLVPL